MEDLRTAIEKASGKGVALGHFNISEFAALRAIVQAAREMNVPVIIGTSEGEAGFIGMKEASALIGAVRGDTGQQIYLNADHMRSIDKAKEAAEVGYDSVIFDAAGASFEENIKETKNAVEELKSINPDILVEGEIGYIGVSSKILDEVPEGAAITRESMTTAEQAKQFVEETRVDLLAPAVGEIHGMMRNAKNPDLDIERIRDIKKAVSVPLVLHGGSGISDDDMTSAIYAGISIVHVNTEIRIAWRRGLEEGLAQDDGRIAPYKILSDPEGKFSDPEEEIYKVVLKRLKLFNRLI